MKLETHIMLDLETLGTAPGCKVLSIGAVVFGPAGLGAEFYIEIARAGQRRLKEDPDTLAWWLKQDAVVRDRLLGSQRGKPALPASLNGFSGWVETACCGGSVPVVWGNGAGFDQPILAAAYVAVKRPPPWKFFDERCYRTLKNLKPSVKLVRSGNLHNALDDAKSQAEHAVRIFREMGLWQQPSAS